MAIANDTILMVSPRETAPVSSPRFSVTSDDSSPLATTISTTNRLMNDSSTERAVLNEDLVSFIAVGILEPNGGANIIPRNGTAFPELELKILEKHHWVRTTTHSYHNNPQLSYVRVYVLPDDVGRKLIPRASSALRRALRTVMSKVDPSPGAWAGHGLSQSKILPTVPASAEDESLWYIFNTLEDPHPEVEVIRDLYAKQAMQDVLSVSTPTDQGEEEIQEGFTGVMGLKTPLYPYQRRSAAFMIQREAQPAQMLDPRLQTCTSPLGQEYYYDKEKGSLYREKSFYSEACGGILAETMGCGKTLISLAVILATRGHFPQIPLEFQHTENPVRDKTGSLVEMAAAVAGRFSLPWKAHFDRLRQMGEFYDRCVQACEAQRGYYTIEPSVGRYSGRASVDYPRFNPQTLRLCSGTLIISPPNLVDHWQSEIKKHTEGLKVLTLRSGSDKTPSPDQLLVYDIILFSKSRFEKEAEGSGNKGTGSLRNEPSHLTKVHWLRIIVDEGHNVAGHGHRTNMEHLIDQLHVERRWVVSGTPSSGLYGVEVSLASQEAHTSDTDLTEATTAVLQGRKKTGKTVDTELKDLDKLGRIVVKFLGLKPWSNTRGDDYASWNSYMKPIGEDGKRRKTPSLRATLQGLVVRHRLDVINNEIPLPRLYNKVVHLEPTFHDKLTLNLFVFNLAVNAITSERKDQDYMFHPRNRKHLSRVIGNLRQAGFWWAGSEGDLPGTIDIATKFLESNRDRMCEDDIATLARGIEIANVALTCGSWQGFKKMHELGVFVSGFPSEARAFWALDPSQTHCDPLLLGISQARHAQNFVTAHLHSYDPAEGLSGAGIKVRSELAGREGRDYNSPSSTPVKATPMNPIKNKPPKGTFSKGLFKELPQESPLKQTKLVATTSAKLSYLLDQVQELHKEEKIIIFYDNNNSAYWIAEGLELLGIDFRIYANTLKPALREEYLTLFRESHEVRVLLMDLGQASHGLHIAHASRVFIINPIWRPNVESQAIKRAHRIGQTRPVFVETLVLKDTLEDKMLQRRKAMSDTEIQHDLLDDSTMSSIIQDERFIPMPNQEVLAPIAFLKEPVGFFDRHRLPIPDHHVPVPPSTNEASPRTLEKRKRVTIARFDIETLEEFAEGPDMFTAKRPKNSPQLGLQGSDEIAMEFPPRRQSLSPFKCSALAN